MIRIIRTNVDEAILKEKMEVSKILNTATEAGSIIDVVNIKMHIGTIEEKEVAILSTPKVTNEVLLITKLSDLDDAINLIVSEIKNSEK